MKKPVMVSKKKLKKDASKQENLSLADAKASAKKAEQLLKNKKQGPTEFIEVE